MTKALENNQAKYVRCKEGRISVLGAFWSVDLDTISMSHDLRVSSLAEGII